MKRTAHFIVLFLISASCGDDGVALFDKDVTFTKSVNVDVPENAQMSFLIERNINAATNPEVENIVEQIDSYTLNQVSYSVSNYSGEPTTLKEATIVVESTTGEQLATSKLTNVALQAISGDGAQVINFDQSEIDAVEQELLENNAVDLILLAEIDNTPVAFQLDVMMNVTIEYRVLD